MVTQRAEMDPLLLIAEWRRIKGASDHLILAAAEIIHPQSRLANPALFGRFNRTLLEVLFSKRQGFFVLYFTT